MEPDNPLCHLPDETVQSCRLGRSMDSHKTPSGNLKMTSGRIDTFPQGVVSGIDMAVCDRKPEIAFKASHTLDDEFPWGRMRRLPKKG